MKHAAFGAKRIRRWRAARVLRASALVVAVLAGILVVAPLQQASAATTAQVVLDVDQATSLSGAQLQFTAGFAVSGGTLQNAQVQIFFPRAQYRSVFPNGGGLGSTVSTDATGTTITYFLGAVTGGTIGNLSAIASSMAYLPDGTTVTATATISGIGLAPGAPDTASTTVSASSEPNLVKESVSAVAANGPAGHSGEAGFNITYDIRAASACPGFGTQLGCLPFQGTLTETLPAQSFFVSAGLTPEYLLRATGAPEFPGDTTGVPWTFPAGFPNGADLSGLPAAGAGPGATFSIPVFLQPLTARQLSDGRYAQGDDHDDLPLTDPLSDVAFTSGGLTVGPPMFRVVVWVPGTAVPPAVGATFTNAVHLAGPNGSGGTVNLDATADTPIGVPVTPPAPAFLSLANDRRVGFGGSGNDCRGYGVQQQAGVAFAWDPAVGGGNQSCVIREGTFDNKFVFGVFSGGVPFPDVRVTVVLPPELDYQPSFSGSGFQTLLSDDPTCGASSPDALFTAAIPPTKVRCIRFLDADGRSSPAFDEYFLQPTIDVAPGTFRRVSVVATASSSNGLNLPSVTQDVAIVDRFTQGTFFFQAGFGATFRAGDVVDLPIGVFGDQGGPTMTNTAHDWTLAVDLPPQLSFVDLELLQAPVSATTGLPLTVNCSFDAGTQRATCIAPGDANAAPAFNARLRARVVPGTPAGNFSVDGCAYSQAPPGSPVNPAGQSLFWRSVHSSSLPCSAAGSEVSRIQANVQVVDRDPPPAPLNGLVLFDVSATRVSPVGSPIDPGDQVSYTLDYAHQPGSAGDLHGAFIYDFLGRDPLTGAPVGDVIPTFVSAQSTNPDGLPETLEFTCTANPTITNPAVVWVAAPCAGVTGVRWRLNSTVAPSDPPGSYRVSDPPGSLKLTVQVPLTATVGQVLVNLGGIAATGFPPAAGQAESNVIGGEPPVIEDVSDTGIAPGTFDLHPGIDDPDGDADLTTLAIVPGSLSPPFAGTVSADATGTLLYTSDPAFTGSLVTFDYQVCDSSALCDTGSAVLVLDHAPVAVDDTATAIPGGVVTIDTYANDTDPDGDDLRLDGDFSLVSPFTVGFADTFAGGPLDGEGVLRYFAPAGFTGTDTAQYEVCDQDGACATATVSVDVSAAAVPHAPVAIIDLVAAPPPSDSIDIDVVANDVDQDDDLDRTSVTITVDPSEGSVTVDPSNGVVTYVSPAGGVPIGDGFEYQVCDVFALCDRATVALTAGAVPSPPDAADDAITAVAGVPRLFDPFANDADPDGDLRTSSFTVVSGPTQGTAVYVPDDTVRYSAAAGASGVDSFTYQVCDDSGLCDTAVVTVTLQAPPVAVGDALPVVLGLPSALDVTANDSDPDGNLDPGSVSIVTPPTQGTATPTGGGVVDYVPNAGASGNDVFTYQVCDTTGLCAQADVNIGFGGAPIAVDDAATVVGPSVAIDLTANDVDPDGDLDVTSVTITATPAEGSVAVDPVTGVATYSRGVVTPGSQPTVTFTYRVCDALSACDTAVVTVTVALPPVANDDEFTVRVGATSTLAVADNDGDPNDDILRSSVSIVEAPGSGQVAVSRTAPGSIVYTASAPGDVIPQGQVGTAAIVGVDSFTYQICDVLGLCDQASVTIDLDDGIVVVPPIITTTTTSTSTTTTSTTTPSNPIPFLPAQQPPSFSPPVGSGPPVGATPVATPTATPPVVAPTPPLEADDEVVVEPSAPGSPLEIELSSAGSAAPGGTVSLRGSGCDAGSRVVIAIDGDTVATTTADDDGDFSADVDEAPTEIGRHEVTATCEGATVSVPLDLVQTSSDSPDNQVGVVFAFFVLLAAAIVHGREQSGRPAMAR